MSGGAGFIGSHLCDLLLAEGQRGALRRQLLHRHASATSPTCSSNPHFELIRHDVTFPLYVEVDEIYNLACPASPIHYQYDPVQTTKVSVHGAINMLGLAKRVQGARSSRPRPARSTATPRCTRRPRTTGATSTRIGLRSCYDEGKRCAETLFFDYHRQHRLRHQGRAHLQHLRPAHAPQRRPRGLQLHRAGAHAASDITVYGDGSQTRSFCYVDDLIEGFVRLMDDPRRVHRAGQPRQPRRVHHPSSWPSRSSTLTGSQLEDRAQAAAGRRPDASASPTSRWRAARCNGNRKWRCVMV
ncbi:MAG: GDP-mannose 4,6-dehydratase [Rhodopseudomonas palustris]|nr:GDP-mannose 4,6-dehydratase [Rhodopseudomonas palustris]